MNVLCVLHELGLTFLALMKFRMISGDFFFVSCQKILNNKREESVRMVGIQS